MNTIIVTTPDDLQQVITEGTAPLAERLAALEKKVGIARLGYSSAEVAELLGVSERTVRGWVTAGKADAEGRVVYLTAHELLPRRYRITTEAVEAFIRHF